jgi:hypothetical protein
MTTEGIAEKQAMENIKFETAKQIRALLDAAAKKYGETWDGDGAESEILELVTEG